MSSNFKRILYGGDYNPNQWSKEVWKDDMDALGSSAIGLQVKGKTQQMNLTIEGVGNDATLYGFGILARNCRYVEFRNLAVMLHPEDGISFDTNNHHIWGHNLDIFYGQNKGGDKAKGDGSFDVKGTQHPVAQQADERTACRRGGGTATI